VVGDAYDALHALARIPEYADNLLGKVKLVYIDPPFNTGGAFAQYDDALEHSVWLTMMRDRLLLIRELLAPNGSVWVHLDDAEMAYCRVLMDEIFGRGNFLASVVWQRTSAKSLAKRTMGVMHETILVYGASEIADLKTVYLPMADEYVAKRFTQNDERGPYDTGDLTATSHRPHLDSGQPWRGFNPSDLKRCWAPSPTPLIEAGITGAQLARMTIREKLDALDEAGYIHWPKGGGFPRFKKYLHGVKGRAIGDLWTDINVVNSQAAERTGFSTQKPEALIRRVLEIATEPGDIVVDCFAGSGTTAAVAHKMGRRWITVEKEQATIDTFIYPRLERIIAGQDGGGITAAASWKKGGGFRVLEVRPSMYEVRDQRAFLAEWATNGAFAAGVAAQLGFHLTHEAPFSGRKGRTRLAVIDGVIDTEVVRAITSRLNNDERTVLVGKGATPDAAALLKSLNPGSRLRKAPRDLLRRGVVR